MKKPLAMLAVAASLPTPVLAQEIASVPVESVVGHPYSGFDRASHILFINTRQTAVEIIWIGFDGVEHVYVSRLDPGQQVLQPTYLAHRWLVRDATDNSPVAAFISTRMTAWSMGTPQIAIIR